MVCTLFSHVLLCVVGSTTTNPFVTRATLSHGNVLPGSLDAFDEPARATDDSDVQWFQASPVGSALGISRSPAQVLHSLHSCLLPLAQALSWRWLWQ